MIRYSKNDDKMSVLQLFKICFPGEVNFADWFFSDVFQSENTLVYETDGKIIAALQTIPVELKYREKTYKSSYLYGVGTLPEYRGKGVMKELIDFTLEEEKKNLMDFAVLIVQSQSLLNYYERFGFKRLFGVSEKEITAENHNLKILEMSEKDFTKTDNIYTSSVSELLRPIRDEKHYKRLLDLYRDGSFKSVGKDGMTAYSFGYFKDGKYIACESFGTDAERLVSQIAFEKGLGLCEMSTRGSDKIIGMLKELNIKCPADCGYINLLFN